MKILALITARGGSKRLPGKNLMDLEGLPMIAHTIRAAQGSAFFGNMDLICSTDDPRIAQTAKDFACEVPFIRPANLAGDNAGSLEVVKHALDFLSSEGRGPYDWLLLLQPTSPLRESRHIDEAIQIAEKNQVDSVVSVVQLKHKAQNLRVITDDGALSPLVTESGFGQTLAVNGSIYLTQVECILKESSFFGQRSLPYIMDSENSIDIDTIDDFRSAQKVLSERGVQRVNV